MKQTAEELERYLDGECSQAEAARIEADLKAAPDLACELDRMRRIDQAVRGHCLRTRAPETLCASVSARFGKGDDDAPARPAPRFPYPRLGSPHIDRGRRRALIGAGGLLAAGIAAVAIGPTFFSAPGAADPVDTFFRDFETYLLKDRAVDVSETNMVQLAGWFSDRLPFALPPIGSSGGGAALIGGRLCWLLDRRLASLSYETADGPIVVYVMDADGIALPEGRETSEIGDQLSWHRSKASTSLMWRSGDLLVVMVGTQEVRRLMTIAQSLVG